jgi:adenine-specific DNA-methyltransferase
MSKFDGLLAKLKEIFQMDQADLDFGIYRIMNVRRDEITRFLEQDLLPTVRSILEQNQPAGLAEKDLAGCPRDNSPKINKQP